MTPDPTAPDTASQLPAQGQAYRAPLPPQPVAPGAAMWTGRTKSPLRTCQRAGGAEVPARPVPTQPMPRVLASHRCHAGVTQCPCSLCCPTRPRRDISPSHNSSCGFSCHFLPFAGSGGSGAGKAQAKRRQSAACPAAPPWTPASRRGWAEVGTGAGRWGWGLHGAGFVPGWDKKGRGANPEQGTPDGQALGQRGCSMGKGCRTRGCGSRSGVPCPPLPFPAPLRGQIQPRKGPWS